MQYHIDTIPVWDAMKQGAECPLCVLRRKLEADCVQRFLGASVMEPDTRVRVNAKGFCVRHQERLFAEKNRLGLALLMESHADEALRVTDAALLAARKAAGGASQTPFLKRLFRRKDTQAAFEASAKTIGDFSESCILCDTLSEHMTRYAQTFLYLYKTDESFRDAFAASKGVCLKDASLLLALAPRALNAAKLVTFTDTLATLEHESLSRIRADVTRFTKAFDYRNAGQPLGESRDAVERVVNKLQGVCVGEAAKAP